MIIKSIIKKIFDFKDIKEEKKFEKIEKAVKRGVKEYEETFRRLAQT